MQDVKSIPSNAAAATPQSRAERRLHGGVDPAHSGAFEGLWSSRRLRAWLLSQSRPVVPPHR